MKTNIRREYNYLLQVISAAFGFLLMLSLSANGIWSSYFVVFLLIILSSVEKIWLKKIKQIHTIRWLGSNWILLAGAFTYIMTNSMAVKYLMFFIMIISVYVNLYRECYYEKVSFQHIRCIVSDLPLLAFNYILNFFERNELVNHRIQRKKCINGFCILFIVLLCVYIPLYTSVDNRITSLLFLIVTKIISILPVWIMCGLLGVVPAMINYSIVRGLAEDIVLQNPERNHAASICINNNNLYFNEIVIKIILLGLVVVNVVFMGLQVSDLFRIQESSENMKAMYNMKGIFPLLVSIGISVLFVVMSEYLIVKKAQGLLQITFVYIISLIALLLLAVYRFILKVSNYGIERSDMVGFIGILFLGIMLSIALYSIIVTGKRFLNKLFLWGTICFVIISLLPIDYITAQINVNVFLNRYEKEEVLEIVTSSDIDMSLLQEMGYDAVPALVKIMNVPILYKETNKSLGETAKEIVVEMFTVDMSDEEIERIEGLKTERGITEFKDILSEKAEYRVIGKRKMAFLVFYERLLQK